MVQAGCFVYVHVVRADFKGFLNPRFCCKYISFSLFIVITGIVPILSIVHYCLNLDIAFAADNTIRSWLLIYPVMGVTGSLFLVRICPIL